MKKLFLYAAASGFLFTSCQKEDSNEATPNNGLKPTPSLVVGPLPKTFVKKVMIEEFTSASNGMSPQSADVIYSILKGSGDRVYHTALHSQDIMYNSQASRLMTAFIPNASTLPCATIDRFNFGGTNYLTPTQYTAAVSSKLSTSINCGIAMRSSYSNRTAYLDLYVGIHPGSVNSYNVTTYLVEDVIVNGSPDFFQDNLLNNDPSSNYFNMGNPVMGFPHKNVLRKIISKDMGDAVNPTMLANGSNTQLSYEFDLPNKLGSNSNWKIISFITDASTNEILNVQMGELGKLKNWN